MFRYLGVAQFVDNKDDSIKHDILSEPVKTLHGCRGMFGVLANSKEEAVAKSQAIWNRQASTRTEYGQDYDLMGIIIVEYEYIDRYGDLVVANDWPDRLVGTQVYEQFRAPIFSYGG